MNRFSHHLKEVASGIFVHTQTIGFQRKNFSVNIYLLAGEGGLVFDAGYGGKKHGRGLGRAIRAVSGLKNSSQKPNQITRALPSHGHWDHFSGLKYLQDHLGIEICATRKQAETICSKQIYKQTFRGTRNPFHIQPKSRFKQVCHQIKDQLSKELFMALLNVRFVSGPVTILNEDSVLTVDRQPWQILPLPGHADDDIVLYNRDRGIVLGGDILLNSVTTWLGPPRSNLADYTAGLEHLKTLPRLRLILPGHGRPIRDPIPRIQSAIDHRNQRTQDLFRVIADAGNQGIGFETVFQHFYPAPKAVPRYILEGWICLTLDHLIETGKIRISKKEREVRFHANDSALPF